MQSSNSPGNSGIVWLNGRLVSVAEAAVSPFDHGLLTGDGVFETLKAYRGEPFAHSRHYQRLANSARTLGLEPPPEESILEAMRSVIRANGKDDVRVRVTVTGGIGPLGSDRHDSEQTLLVAVSDLPPYLPSVNVATVPWPRNERGALVGLKTTSYAENVMALQYAFERGCQEAIFGNLAGNLCEGTGSNVFYVSEGQLVTPTLQSGCLGGITRSVVIDLCGELGIEVHEVDTPLDSLEKADEAFLTGTLKEVKPILEVDEKSLGTEAGPVTEQLVAAFTDLVGRDLDP